MAAFSAAERLYLEKTLQEQRAMVRKFQADRDRSLAAMDEIISALGSLNPSLKNTLDETWRAWINSVADGKEDDVSALRSQYKKVRFLLVSLNIAAVDAAYAMLDCYGWPSSYCYKCCGRSVARSE